MSYNCKFCGDEIDPSGHIYYDRDNDLHAHLSCYTLIDTVDTISETMLSELQKKIDLRLKK